MQFSQFDNIRVVLAEPNIALRLSMTECLHEHGFRSVLDTGNLSQVASAVKEGTVDLLIADTSLPEGDFNGYVRELRHGKHGHNPFLVTITLVNKPSRDAVATAIDSGTDHVLAKPFDPKALIDQVLELTHRRKRFVVTTDYIGPDRRNQSRSGGMPVPLVDVPNALRQRMTGQMSDSILVRSIEAAKAAVNEQKVVRHAFQIGWLLERMLPELGAEIRSETFLAHMQRLHDVSGDIALRIRSTRYAHVAEMCMTLSNMVASAMSDGFTEHDVMLLGKIAKLVEAAFDPDREALGASYRNKRSSVFAGPEAAQNAAVEPDSQAEPAGARFQGAAVA